MRPGTRGNDKCLDGHRACICDYGMGAVRIEFNIEHASCKDLPPIATERTSQRLDEREWVRAMAMIWKPHGPLEDRGQRRLKLPDLLRCQDFDGHAASPAEVDCQPVSPEGGFCGVDMKLTDAMNEPLCPCLSNKRHEVFKQRTRESNKRIGAALHRVQSTSLHEPPEPG